jgi:hypothetical protein
MTMDINELQESFDSLQAYSDSQFKTILDLKRQLETLKAENESLKKMLEGSVANIQLQVSNLGVGVSNEQIICETQIALLKTRAISQELTMEEARKLEIYYKILAQIKDKNEEAEDVTATITESDLLKLVNNDNA